MNTTERCNQISIYIERWLAFGRGAYECQQTSWRHTGEAAGLYHRQAHELRCASWQHLQRVYACLRDLTP